MKEPIPDKEVPKPKASDEDRLLILKQYADTLREFLKKLRNRLH